MCPKRPWFDGRRPALFGDPARYRRLLSDAAPPFSPPRVPWSACGQGGAHRLWSAASAAGASMPNGPLLGGVQTSRQISRHGCQTRECPVFDLPAPRKASCPSRSWEGMRSLLCPAPSPRRRLADTCQRSCAMPRKGSDMPCGAQSMRRWRGGLGPSRSCAAPRTLASHGNMCGWMIVPSTTDTDRFDNTLAAGKGHIPRDLGRTSRTDATSACSFVATTLRSW
jgi:hypothetical protein